LSWIAILRKRDNFRRAFDGFDPQIIANYDRRKLEALMADAGIVRNRAKIAGAVASARAYLDLTREPGGFTEFVWRHTGGRTLQNGWRAPGEVPTETPESRALSAALKQRNFAFVGPTIVYAFMQAVGMVNDHLTDCFRHRELIKPKQ
jgi:DNA-3-methyladenine glycosylase I